ncbi:GTP-binding protein [Photobacterium angustum]|uniref:disulfide bond formation protein B n=1 Tax=Photobacterium angustum TaxID=661 RepID=UPI000D1BBABC|nr:disulfide bond formation protein B [Photobacterium angustum]PSV95497.1 GTP-binding protein [Photobacterium angustum]
MKLLNRFQVSFLSSVLSLGFNCIPIGIATIILSYTLGDNPCIICWEERIAIILISLNFLIISRYGLRLKYICTFYIICIYGLWLSIYHSSAHLHQDIGQGFGGLVLGAHEYIWGVLLFISTLLIMSFLIGFSDDEGLISSTYIRWGLIQKLSGYSFIFIASLNVIQAFTQVGPPPFIGQSNPESFSYSLSDTVWSTKHWPSISSFSFRGSNYIEQPNFDKLKVDDDTKLEDGKIITPNNIIDLPSGVNGRITGITYSKEYNIIAFSTNKNWVYIVDSKFSKILSKYKIDSKFSTDVNNISGISIYKNRYLIVNSTYKSYVKLSIDKLFKMKEISRGNLNTIRAKNSYIGSSAVDNKEYLTLSLPNKFNKKLVLSHFSLEDMILNSENIISLNTVVTPSITGMAIRGNNMFLLNNSGKQLIIIDKNTSKILKKYDLGNTNNPQGITVTSNKVLISDQKNGKNTIKSYLI